jgi:hypothetical protein
MLILRGQIAKKRERVKISQLQADLNSILNEWQWENKPCPNAQDFLNKMKPWVQGRIKEQQERKEFLKKFKIKNLSQIKEVKL